MARTLPYPNPANATQWAEDLLARLGDPATKSNTDFLTSWIAKESGSGYSGLNGAIRYNPLNTVQPEPGSVGAGSQGNIASYPTPSEGLAGDTTALLNGRYQQITAALAQGDATQANASGALNSDLTTWGTGPVQVSGAPAAGAASPASSTSSPSTAQTTGIVGSIGGFVLNAVASPLEQFLVELVFIVGGIGLIIVGLTRLFPDATRTVTALAV